MLFNSIVFLFFFIIVFFVYWLLIGNSIRLQNVFLLVSSYFFYGWWDWRFLFLLFFISVANYLLGIIISKQENIFPRKTYLVIGLLINIGTLVFFKYFNFFIDGFIEIITFFGISTNSFSLRIIIPLGISFYIFLSISYIVDVYQRKLEPIYNFLQTLLAFSFFPIILAGPIQRPKSLLPQIQEKRVFNYGKSIEGLKQILWGVFMKVVIADNCAVFVDNIFSNFLTYSGSTLMFGVFLFSIQIYTDFGGYSNIAIGLGKLLGFNIMQNFAYPYFARNIKEFWQRWNISLTQWFRDYVFLPTAYSVSRRIKPERVFYIKTIFIIYTLGIVITWLLTGLWHGANFTFVIWGLIHGIYLIINHTQSNSRKRILKNLKISNQNIILKTYDIFITFILVMFTWIFFKAENIEHARSLINSIISSSLLTIPTFPGIGRTIPILGLAVFFFTVEWLGRNDQHPLLNIGRRWPLILKWSFFSFIVFLIGMYMHTDETPFIYFQF